MSITFQIGRLMVFGALTTVVLAQPHPVVGHQNNSQEIKAVPGDTLITLERTPCYGMCPMYKITISADGTVVFQGTRFVKTVGAARTAISPSKVRELIDAFARIKYFELNNQYATRTDGCKQWFTDNPSAITSITVNARSKTVRHDYGCRGVDVLTDLEKLEREIDLAVNSDQWIR